MLCLSFMGRYLSHAHIAQELEVHPNEVQIMASQRREGIVPHQPDGTRTGEVECDEVALVAGHTGYPEAVTKKAVPPDAAG